MPTHRFEYETMGIEISVENAEAFRRIMDDVRDLGLGRFSLQGGRVVIDLGLRTVAERRHDAALQYRIFDGDREVFSVTGSGMNRTYRGGRRGSNLDATATTYSF